MQLQPYLSFDGRCEEAIDFYRRAVDAEVVMLMRFSDAPDPAMHPPGGADKVMHAALRIGDSQIMCTDGGCQGRAVFQGTSLALTVADENLRPDLKREGFLTRDARIKERKKAGLKGARKRPQFSKR